MLHVYGLATAPWPDAGQEMNAAELPSLLSTSPRSAATRALVEQLRSHHAPTAAHSARVARVLMLMWARAPERLGDPEPLLIGGALHDIGKLFVPAATLSSEHALDAAEREMIRRHPETGAEVLRSLGFPPLVIAAARDHHERWDGGGYPSGMRSEGLHVVARATAVADAYVAMVEPGRRYRSPLDRDAAVIEIAACRGTHFDPEMAGILIDELTGPGSSPADSRFA